MSEPQCLNPHLSVLRHLIECPTLSRRLRALVFGILRCWEDVEIVLQKIWVRVLQSPPLASWRGDLRRWIAVVARNAALDRFRRNRREAKRRKALPTELVDHRAERAARREEAEQQLQLLYKFVGEPRDDEPRTHRVLRLVREGATNEQIAAELGMTVGAVKGHRRRAIEKFHTWRAERGESEDNLP